MKAARRGTALGPISVSSPGPAEKLLREVRELRKKAADKKLPVMFSPRASIHAARLLEAGVAVGKIRQWCLIRGLSAAHRTALGLKDSA